MAQWRKTFFSLGGPEYINDPRVDEAVALGQLLQQHQNAANAQADRLFQRKQDTAQFDERRRQFNEEQKRLGDAAKMQEADQLRQSGLAERELQQRQAESQARQAGQADDRLFARSEAQRQGSQFQTEQDRLRTSEANRLAAEVGQQQERRAADVLDRAEQSGQAEANRALQRDLAKETDVRAAARDKANFQRTVEENNAEAKRQQARLQQERDLLEKKQEKAVTDQLGTVEEQRQRGLGSLVSRFEDEVKAAKTQKDDQSKVEALKLAVEHAVNPPPDVEGKNNVDMGVNGKLLPVWKPTPEDYAALKPVLLEIAAKHFPAERRVGFPNIHIPGSGEIGPTRQGAPANAYLDPFQTEGRTRGLLDVVAMGLDRGLFNLLGGEGTYLGTKFGDFTGVPRWTEDFGRQAVEEALSGQAKNAALFARKK